MHLYSALLSLTLLMLVVRLLYRNKVQTNRIKELENKVTNLTFKFDHHVTRNNGLSSRDSGGS
jgi:hypothetical protein